MEGRRLKNLLLIVEFRDWLQLTWIIFFKKCWSIGYPFLVSRNCEYSIQEPLKLNFSPGRRFLFFVSIRMNASKKIHPKDFLEASWNRSINFTATFFLSKKSSQKSQDGRNLSSHKACAGPVCRHSSPPRTYSVQFLSRKFRNLSVTCNNTDTYNIFYVF